MKIGSFLTSYESKEISELVRMIDVGELTLPSWQRDYVWREGQIVDLIDTMLDKASIGTATIWETIERLNNSFKFLNQDLPDYDAKARIRYAIDGQQRLSTLYGLYKGLSINGIDFTKFKIRIEDVENEEDTPMVYYDKNEKLSIENYIRVTDAFQKKVDSNVVSNSANALDVVVALTSYRVNITNSVSDDPDKGRKNFLRINRAGRTLSMTELLNAVIYDDKKGFYLFEKIDKVLSEIEFINVGGLYSSRDKFLRMISSMQEGGVSRGDVERLNPELVMKEWESMVESIKLAVDFLKETFMVKNAKDTNGVNLVYCYSHFFYRNKNKRPTASQKKDMERVFWHSLITDKFSKGSNGEVLATNSIMRKIINEESITLDMDKIPMLESFISSGSFSKLSSINKFSRTICLYLLNNNPKSYVDGEIVTHDTISKSNKLNKDHIFSSHIYKEEANNIFNIALLDFQTNRRKGSKKASEYFQEIYPSRDIMSSHFISEEAMEAVNNDDLQGFICVRAETIRNSLIDFILNRKETDK